MYFVKEHLVNPKINLIKTLSFLFILLFISVSVQAQTTKWTLKQCIDTALNNNLQVQQSSNVMAIQAINLKQDKNNVLPRVNANVSETFGSGRTLNQGDYSFINDNVWGTNFSLNGSINLFSGFQQVNSIKQSELIYESSKYDKEHAENEITIAIMNAYLQTLFIKELIKNTEKQIESTELQMNRIVELVEIGMKSESEILQMQAQLASDHVNLTNAQNQLRSSLVNLQQQMNIPVTNTFDVAYIDIPAEQLHLNESVEEIFETALSVQPNIKAAEIRSESAAYGIKIARGAYYPSLSLGGSIGSLYSSATKFTDVTYNNSIEPIGYLKSNPNEIIEGIVPKPIYNTRPYPFIDQFSDYMNYSVSLSLSIPIFNGFTARNNVERQRLQFLNAQLEEQTVVNNLRQNIESAYVDVENATANLDATKDQVDAAFVSYEHADIKYVNGLSNMTDMLIEKNKYFVAVSQHLQAKYELLFRMKLLDYYKGIPVGF